MTERCALGPGPQIRDRIRAAQADLLDELPGVRLPDLDELRGRGVFASGRAAGRGRDMTQERPGTGQA
ncbi:hypothetical protein OG462_40660 [Streptomyces sp. NBC_01077]|uniref:hypothetical protein n=1 Tax=Streptomyces sp. NBC_01077 TaxID=2903746 RepID=UPI00386A3F69|nr:hypothetical protein OG462_40660 [Streptomyces sp. NBC_01077]